MANPFKTFFEALLGKNQENDKEIEQAEKLGEIVAYKAESGMGIRNKVHVDAEAARKAAEAKAKKQSTVRKNEERNN